MVIFLVSYEVICCRRFTLSWTHGGYTLLADASVIVERSETMYATTSPRAPLNSVPPRILHQV